MNDAAKSRHPGLNRGPTDYESGESAGAGPLPSDNLGQIRSKLNRGPQLAHNQVATAEALAGWSCRETPNWVAPGGFVYFVESAGLIKIGTTLDLRKRLAGLQSMSAVPVRLIAWADGGRSLEWHIHEALALHRRHGEWFEPHEEVLGLALAANRMETPQFWLKVGRMRKVIEDMTLGAVCAARLWASAGALQ